MAIREVTGARQNYIGLREKWNSRIYRCLIAEMAGLRPKIGDVFTNLVGNPDTVMDTAGMRVVGVSDGTMRGDKNVEFTVEASNRFDVGTLARPGLAVVRWRFGTRQEIFTDAIRLEWPAGTKLTMGADGHAIAPWLEYTLRFRANQDWSRGQKADFVELELDLPAAGLSLTTWQERITESDVVKWATAVGKTNESEWMYFGRDAWKFMGVDTDPTDLKLIQLTFEFGLKVPEPYRAPQGWQWQPMRSGPGDPKGPIWIIYPRTNFNSLLPPYTELVMMGGDSKHAEMDVADWYRGKY